MITATREKTKVSDSDFEVSWDSNSLKQADEAKSIYQQMRLTQRRIIDENDKSVQSFREVASFGFFKVLAAVLNDDELAFRILDNTGDQRLIWNLKNPNQVAEAKERFEKHIKSGGRAYAIFRDGSKAHRIKSFLEEREEVILEDKTPSGSKAPKVVEVKSVLRDFVKRIYEVKLVPKTYPG